MKDKKLIKKSWEEPKHFMVGVFFCLIILMIALTYVCLFKNAYGTDMEKYAANRSTYSKVLYAKRGTIYDSDKNALALNVSSYTVIAYLSQSRTGSSKIPKHVVDVKKTAEALSPIINMTVDKLVELMSKKVYQVELGPGGRGITESVKKTIENLKLPGIDFIESYKRYYPNGDFASYILGYAKVKETIDKKSNGVTTQIIGEMGLESKYNNWLSGENGFLSYQKDRYGYKIPDTKEYRVDAKNGADIYLTIDSNVQRFTESAMRDLENNYHPAWGGIAVMNAKTGDILASSSIPSFDPNIKNIKNYQSPIVTYTYEPGSTMKIYSYMCSIDSGKYNGNALVHSGSLIIGDAEVRDWNRIGWGDITFDKGFAYSSNVAASTLVQTVINKSELRECYEKYGFGDTTGVELSKESTGNITFTYPIEVATASFGQGITTTVMQQLQGLSIIANDGKKVTPHIVDKIIDSNTKKILYKSQIDNSKQIVKKSTAIKMRELMNEVVNSADGNASGYNYRTGDVKLIGKTGTAQIASSSGGYLSGSTDYTYSFAGMFPGDNPEIVIYGAIQKPAYGGIKALSTAIKEIVNNMTKYLNLNGDAANISQMGKYIVDSYKSKDLEEVKIDLASKKINIVTIGKGNKIINQYPSSGTSILSYDKVILITNDINVTIPNFVGWSKKDAKAVLDIIDVKYDLNGTGYVTNQDVPPDTLVTKDTKIVLTLNDKFNLDGVE